MAELTSPDATIRVLIADDHKLVRGALSDLIESEPGFHICGEASNGEETLARLDDCDPSIVLLDLSMPQPSGAELIGLIRARRPDLPILVLSMHSGPAIVRLALHAGANGYLTKDCEPELLLEALKLVARGEPFIARSLMSALISSPNEKRPELTIREIEVMKRLAEGMTNKQAAHDLGLSEKTVSTHKTNLMKKLGIYSMAGLISYARENFS